MPEILLYGVIKLTLAEIETGCFLPQNTLIYIYKNNHWLLYDTKKDYISEGVKSSKI